MLYSGSEFRWHPHFFWMLESWLHTTRSTLSLQEDIEDVFMKLLPPKATRHGESPAAYRCYQLYIGWQTEGRSLKKMQPWWQYFQHKGKARWLYMTWLSPCSYEILWVVQYVLLQFDTCSRAVLQMLPILFHKCVILCPPFSLTCSTMFMLFLRFCSYFLLVVLWLSQFFHVFPMIFMFCSMVFLWCSCVFPWFLLRFSYVFPTFFLRFPGDFPGKLPQRFVRRPWSWTWKSSAWRWRRWAAWDLIVYLLIFTNIIYY